MDEHVASAWVRALINDDADVVDASAKVPGDQVSGRVVGSARAHRQGLSFACKENPQVGDAAVVDVGVGAGEQPASLVGIGGKVPHHVLMNFLLQVDTQSAVGTNDFIGADTGVGGHVAAGIGNAHIVGVVADAMMCPLDGRRAEPAEKFLVRQRRPGLGGAESDDCERQRDRCELADVDWCGHWRDCSSERWR